MVSKSKEARMDQKAYWEERLNKRLSELAAKNIAPERAAKDSTVRMLRAKIRETDHRLQVIEARQRKAEEMAKAKAEKKAAPKKGKKAKAKPSEEKPALSKRQQKKHKKKETTH